MYCSFLITSSSYVPYVASFYGLFISDCLFVLCTLCCEFLWIVHFWLPLRPMYPMLRVSMDCSFLIASSSYVPYVASFYGLFISDCLFVLCTLCCEFLWIVHFWLPLRPMYPMLRVSMDCSFLIASSSYVPYVASFYGLFISDCLFVLCTLCCEFLWIVHFWLPPRYFLTFINLYRYISPTLIVNIPDVYANLISVMLSLNHIPNINCCSKVILHNHSAVKRDCLYEKSMSTFKH